MESSNIKKRQPENIIINKTIYLFLIQLIAKIILKDENTRGTNKINEKIANFIKYINDNIIKGEEKKIDVIYTKQNFRNIFNFIKTQNSKYAGEILENILIIIFSFGFNAKKQNTFGKYLYNNIKKLTDIKDKKDEICEWFIENKFKFNKSFSIKELLKDDINVRQTNLNPIQKEPIFELLKLIYYEKKYKLTKKSLHYLNRGNCDIEEIEEKRLKKLMLENIEKTYPQSSNKSSENNSNIFYSSTPKKFSEDSGLKIIRSLFISVYIYYQNKNSPLMKFIEKSDKEEGLEIKPFEYNLSEAAIEDKYSRVILSPLRIEPRISIVKLMKNRIKENGLKEISKLLIFNNKNIKTINISYCPIKSFYIYYLNKMFGLFDNYSVEEINISLNYINDNSGKYLANMLSHFKNLKTINLSSNKLKNGISPFLIVLKNLYREEKTKLDSLNLIQCELDDIAYYELSELLKCKYCKLKKLYLNRNNIPYCVNFLKKLKKNKSLTRIYFNRSNIGNNDINDIMRIIININIEYLYLNKNQIYNIDQLIRLLYGTKLIKINEDKIDEELYRGETFLFNLDLSSNYCINKNEKKITLFKDIINDTTLHSIDISGIFYGKQIGNLDYFKNKLQGSQNDYINEVDSFIRILKDNDTKYKQLENNINNLIIDIKKKERKIKNEDLFKDLNISAIINNEKAKYSVFIRGIAEEIMKNIKKEVISKKNKEEIKQIYEDLINYITLQKDKNNLKKSEKKLNDKKMIII